MIQKSFDCQTYSFRELREPRLLKVGAVDNTDEFTLDENFDGRKKTKIIIHGWKNK